MTELSALFSLKHKYDSPSVYIFSRQLLFGIRNIGHFQIRAIVTVIEHDRFILLRRRRFGQSTFVRGENKRKTLDTAVVAVPCGTNYGFGNRDGSLFSASREKNMPANAKTIIIRYINLLF